MKLFITSKKPTVCHVLHSLCVGGAETLAARLARRSSSRYRIVFACLDSLGPLGEELEREGFPTYVLNRQPGFDWRCAARFSKLLRDERVDIVHAHQYTPFFYAMMGRRLARRPAVLFTEHGRHFPDHRRAKRVIANRLLLKRRDRVVGVGEAVRQALVANEGIKPDRVGVVFNGIDLVRFRNVEFDATEVRQELGLANGEMLLLQVARLDYLKDHTTALRALKRVTESLPDVRLILVGDGPERANIEQLIIRLGLSEHVRLLGTRRDIPRLLAATDVFLLTSISEGIPLTLIEAMASRVPVIATNVGGVSEVVKNEVTGLLAQAKGDAAIADHIVRLAKAPELRARMGSAGMQRAFTTFAEEQMHDSYDRLYQEMCCS